MARKRKSGYALSDDDNEDGFTSTTKATSTSTATRPSSKRSKNTTSATPPTESTPIITSAHFADVPTSHSPKTDTEGNTYWEISKARRVTLSDFRGKKMVGIREYYEKDGQMLPGKKGISMTLEQYGVMVSLLPGIEGELRKGGITDVPRPDYEAAMDENGDEPSEEGRAVHGQARRGSKANHEATSDEEE